MIEITEEDIERYSKYYLEQLDSIEKDSAENPKDISLRDYRDFLRVWIGDGDVEGWKTTIRKGINLCTNIGLSKEETCEIMNLRQGLEFPEDSKE